MMFARHIKDLAIAYEALSRVPDAYSQASAIRTLLDQCIKRFKEDMTPAQTPPPIQPTTTDDDIPF